MHASVKVIQTVPLMLTRKELTLLSPRNPVLHVWHFVTDFMMQGAVATSHFGFSTLWRHHFMNLQIMRRALTNFEWASVPGLDFSRKENL